MIFSWRHHHISLHIDANYCSSCLQLQLVGQCPVGGLLKTIYPGWTPRCRMSQYVVFHGGISDVWWQQTNVWLLRQIMAAVHPQFRALLLCLLAHWRGTQAIIIAVSNTNDCRSMTRPKQKYKTQEFLIVDCWKVKSLVTSWYKGLGMFITAWGAVKL